MAENNITTAVEFLRLVRAAKDVHLFFIKKDGEERLMHCTLDYSRIPKDKRPKNVDLPKILELINKHDTVRVYDLEKHGWRSVPFSRAKWVEDDNGVKYSIKRKG